MGRLKDMGAISATLETREVMRRQVAKLVGASEHLQQMEERERDTIEQARDRKRLYRDRGQDCLELAGQLQEILGGRNG